MKHALHSNTRYRRGSTAIRAVIYLGSALPRQLSSLFHRYYLKLIRKHVALTTKLTFGYIRLIAFVIGISRGLLFRNSTLPYGAINVSVHDRKNALFRRRAVYIANGCFRTRYRGIRGLVSR